MPAPLSGARGWAAHAGLSRQFEPLDPCSAASAAKATATNACMQPKPRPRHAPGIPITGYLSSPVITPAKYSFVAPTRALCSARAAPLATPSTACSCAFSALRLLLCSAAPSRAPFMGNARRSLDAARRLVRLHAAGARPNDATAHPPSSLTWPQGLSAAGRSAADGRAPRPPFQRVAPPSVSTACSSILPEVPNIKGHGLPTHGGRQGLSGVGGIAPLRRHGCATTP